MTYKEFDLYLSRPAKNHPSCMTVAELNATYLGTCRKIRDLYLKRKNPKWLDRYAENAKKRYLVVVDYARSHPDKVQMIEKKKAEIAKKAFNAILAISKKIK